MLARTGAVGALIFAAMLLLWLRAARGFARAELSGAALSGGAPPGGLLRPLASLATLFIPLNGLLFALVSTGFEGPHFSVLLWFFAGCVAGGAEDRQASP